VRLFDLPQAKHFCNPAPAVIARVSAQSLRSFHSQQPKGVIRIQEGRAEFDVHQVNLLSSIERWLLYSITHYRRAVEMLVPASAPWAQVTLYYSSFFAANAILGTFGGWIGHTQNGNRVVDVEHGVPGSQELRIHRRLSSPKGANGSHRAFWDFFYDSVATIYAWTPKELSPALTPVNGDFEWQISQRNDVNYDMFCAWTASQQFYGTFKASKLKTLRGPLQLQLETTERLIKLGLHFANDVSLSTAALDGCGQIGATVQVRKKLTNQRPPHLIAQSAFYEFGM